MMSGVSLENAELLINTGIINSTTRSRLVGYFYTIFIMMHGSMNIQLVTLDNSEYNIHI